MSLSFSRASISEICQKCDHFAVFAGASAKYLLAKEKGIWRKREGTNEKSVTHHVTSAYVAKAMS
jgi:hypothetical protein